MFQYSLLVALLQLLLQILPIAAIPIGEKIIDRIDDKLIPRQASTAPSAIPGYALQYAPVVYLHTDEQWFPTDVESFLPNVLPYDSNHLALSGLAPTFSSLPTLQGDPIYLSSIQDITTLSDPSWLNSADGKPDPDGKSAAPVEIIVASKEGGITDVFYFFFFAYNKGPEVLGTSFGDHVGDWEHTMIRFENEQPTAIYMSQHNSGTAYSWNAIMKTAQGRPIVYIGHGDHACYAMPGTHTYDTILQDETNAGPIWDTSLNYRSYSFDSTTGQFSLMLPITTPSAAISLQAVGIETEENEGVDWLTFDGYWGDKKLDDDDSRQFCAFGQCRFTDGPLGPYLKNLGRKLVCQDENDCDIHQTL